MCKRYLVTIVTLLLVLSVRHAVAAERVILELNSTALSDISQCAGGFFSVGGALLTIDHKNEGLTEVLFPGVAYTQKQYLILTIDGAETTFSTSDNPFVGPANQGWWSDLDPVNPSNTNYIVGSYSGREYRNFFTFDLSHLSGTVTEGRLDLFWCWDSPDPTETLGLFSVETDAATLNLNGGINAAIFADLGDGKNYGEFTLPIPVIPAPTAVVLGSIGAAFVTWLRRRRTL